MQALELVLEPPAADLLVLVSHEGSTRLTVEAAHRFAGPKWLVTGNPDSELGRLSDEVIVCTPRLEQSLCHTASYTCAVAQLAALSGEDVSGLPGAVETELRRPLPVSEHERWLVAGAGRDWPTAQEAALKLREGAFLAAEAHQIEQLPGPLRGLRLLPLHAGQMKQRLEPLRTESHMPPDHHVGQHGHLLE